MMRAWKRRVPIITFLPLLLAAALLETATAGDPLVASLHQGEAVFWHGPYIEETNTNGCRDDAGACFVYKIEVAEPAARLRVALDYPMGNDLIDFYLRDPGGERVEVKRKGFYSGEIFVRSPQMGIWRVVVVPRFASKTAFRLRAKLEPPAEGPAERRVLAPNLRLEPPFDFRFRPPITMLAGVYAGLGPHALDSCGYDETVEDSARRCLRLSLGPQNAGDGPLELRFSPVTDAATGEAPMFQVVHYGDGTTKERRAGSYEYHKMHGHYHFSGFATLELLKVTDREMGVLEAAGEGHKSGFCFGDVMMNSWHEFIQEPAQSSRSSCQDNFEAYMGLTRGWTDIYTWDTPGNYVEFGDNTDGYYVVRAAVDVDEVILETNEGDNVSYALIQVTGNKVRVLERGFGSDPWDPDKHVVTNWVQVLFGRQ